MPPPSNNPADPRRLLAAQQKLVALAAQLATYDAARIKNLNILQRYEASLQVVTQMRVDAEKALTNTVYRQQLGAVAAISKQMENLEKASQLRGMQEALKSGQLQPLIRDAVELEKQARAVDRAMAWERLKADKGTVGAYLSLVKKHLGEIGTVAGKVWGQLKNVASTLFSFGRARVGFAAVAAAGAVAAAPGRVAGALESTVGKADPAALIRFKMAQEDLAAVIGRLLIPAMERLTQITREVADYFLNLDPATKKLISSLAVAGTTVAGIGVALHAVGPIITVITSGLGAMVAVVGALGAVLGPVGVAIGVGAAALALWKSGILDSVEATGPFGKALEGVKAVMAAVGRAVEKIAVALWPVFTAGLRAIGSVAEALAPKLSRVGELFAEMFQRIAPLIPRVIDLGAELVKLGADALMPVVEVLGRLATEIAPMVVRALGLIAAASQQTIGILKLLGKWAVFEIDFAIAKLKFLAGGLKVLGGPLVAQLLKALEGEPGRGAEPGEEKVDDLKKNFDDFLKRMRGLFEGGQASSWLGRLSQIMGRQSSVGAAVRPAEFTGIAEFGDKARLSAFTLGRDKEAEERAWRNRQQMTLEEVVNQLKLIAGQNLPDRQGAAAAAMRGF